MKKSEIDAQASCIWHTAFSASVNRDGDNEVAITKAKAAVSAFRAQFQAEDEPRAAQGRGPK